MFTERRATSLAQMGTLVKVQPLLATPNKDKYAARKRTVRWGIRVLKVNRKEEKKD